MSPLELNSPAWSRLQDAYGTANEIPQLLADLAGGNSEPLYDLYGCICHQMTVYSASIAAFPHLVAISATLESDPSLQVEILCLAGAICESREFEHELQSSEFAAALEEALPPAIALAEAALRTSLDPSAAAYLLKSIAAFQKMPVLARALEGFTSDEFVLECPACSSELYVWPCPEGFLVGADDPASREPAERTLLVPGIRGRAKRQDDWRWLEQQCANVPSLALVHAKLPFLFGEASCPRCTGRFTLFDQLFEQDV
ncbi:hypothetical protein [Pseudoduganella sp. HUAS MS19]